MSHNITKTTWPVLEVCMDAEDIVYFHDECEDELCESNFIDEHYKEAKKVLNNADILIKIVKIRNLYWDGEGSGRTLDFLISGIIPHMKGKAEVVFIWEGGQNITGLIIENGKATKCPVETRVIRP